MTSSTLLKRIVERAADGPLASKYRSLLSSIEDGTHRKPGDLINEKDIANGNKVLRKAIDARRCKHLGGKLTIEEGKRFDGELISLGVKLNTCNGQRKEYHCGKRRFTNLAHCMGCGEWEAEPSKQLTPTRVIRFDHHNLVPHVQGMRFNPSIIEHGKGYAFCFRNGWRGSNLYMVRMNQEFQPVGDAVELRLRHRDAGYGREDPRLFRLNGRLHVMFIGVVGGRRIRHTNVLFARLRESDFAVEDIFHPDVPNRKLWEKNFQFFDYRGVAHAVYSIAPHKILRIEGNKATWVCETQTKFPWSGGRLCGGASPVLHNGEFYSFFHGSNEHGRRRYNMGVYTFSTEPPFAITRMTKHPIDMADLERKHDNYCDVIFPGGAVYRDGQWYVAMGVHDRHSEIRAYDARQIEKALG